MTRIVTDGGLETLRVEGRLTRHTGEELRMACEAALNEHGPLRLEVSGLQFADPAGVGLLRSLQSRGIGLVGCSGLVDELLRPGPAPSAHHTSDAALVERLRAGDAEAYETLIREYGGRMLATARRFLGSEDEARDVLQEAFLAAFHGIDGFHGTAQLSTWLHRIVVNGALMRLRSRRRRREEPIDDLLPRFDDEGHWVDSPAWSETTAEGLLARRETRQWVRDAIERLPVSYRTVLMLRDIDELDTDETASLLGITPNAVKVRLHRARQALRSLLEKELGTARPNGRANPTE